MSDHHHAPWSASSIPKTADEFFMEGSSPFGAITATLDWCEENYYHAWFIAEFFNTLSNLAMILLGLYGAYRTLHQGLPTRIVACYLALFAVGCGSALFHGTLLFSAQLADELPMIYADAVFLYCVAPGSWRQFHRPRLLLGLVGYAAIVTGVYVFTRDVLFFEFSYAVGVGIILFRCVKWFVENPKEKRARRTILLGALAFVGAFGLWNVDNLFCDRLREIRVWVGPVLAPLFQFHALWHLGTGYGTYSLGIFLSNLPEDSTDVEKFGKKIVANMIGLPIMEVKRKRSQL